MRKLLLLLVMLPYTAGATDFGDPGSLTATAVERHPGMARIRAEAAAARERIAPATALPNPMLMAGVQNKEIDLSDDEMMTMYMVGASQRITRPSIREARGTIARIAAESIELQAESLRAEIERDVLLAWYEVAAADDRIAITLEIRETIEAIIAAARVRYEVGTAVQADVIRAQLQLSELDQDILSLRAARRTAALRLLSLLDLSVPAEVPRLTMPRETAARTIPHESVPPEDHPAFAALRLEITGLEEEARLARLLGKPDIDIEASYGFRPTQQDMFSVVARVELPLRRDRTIEPRVREANLRAGEVTTRIEELRRELALALAEAVVAHDEATEQLSLYEGVLVPQSRLAFESTLAAYQSGSTSFDSILATEAAYVRLRLQQVEFLNRHVQAVVVYEAIQRGARGGSVRTAALPSSSSSPTGAAAPMNGM